MSLSYHRHLQRRVKDLDKNIKSAQHELDALRESKDKRREDHASFLCLFSLAGTDVISETQMFRVQEALQANTKNLEDVFRSGERQSNSLEILQVSEGTSGRLLQKQTLPWLGYSFGHTRI